MKLVEDDIYRNLGSRCYDHIHVFDEIDKKNNDSRGLFQGTFCDSLYENFPIIKSKTNTMYVHFISDSSVGYKGFIGEIAFTYGNCIFLHIYKIGYTEF